jgi:hypothetical protein
MWGNGLAYPIHPGGLPRNPILAKRLKDVIRTKPSTPWKDVRGVLHLLTTANLQAQTAQTDHFTVLYVQVPEAPGKSPFMLWAEVNP